MAVNYAVRYMDLPNALQVDFLHNVGVAQHSSKGWQPPVYTSLKWFYFQNYSFIILTGLLAETIAYGFMHYVFGWVL